MKLQQFTYLFSIIIFGGFYIWARWKSRKRALKKYEVVVLFMVAVSLPFTLVDFFALKWGAWVYSPERTLNVKFAAPLETYIFSAVVVFIISTSTLASAMVIDKKSKRRTKRQSSRVMKRLKLRRV